MFEEETKAKAALYAAILLTFAGYGGRFAGVEPLYNQFFPWAAWAYVLFADNLVYRLWGTSPLISRTGEFLVLAAWSLGICSVFSLLNLRLGSWYYMDQPSTLALRWMGRAFSWGALLPSLFVTEELLRSAGLFGRLRSPSFRAAPALLDGLLAAGLLALGLALAAPAFFRPLGWAAPLLLAEPLSFRLGLPSLLRELQGGVPGKTLRLAAAGLICGLLWNCWNSAAGARWVYQAVSTGPALFGLPAAGYALFSVFALEAYALYALASWLRGGRTWEEGGWDTPGPKPRPAAAAAGAAFIIVTSYIAFRLADSYSVKLYLGWL